MDKVSHAEDDISRRIKIDANRRIVLGRVVRVSLKVMLVDGAVLACADELKGVGVTLPSKTRRDVLLRGKGRIRNVGPHDVPNVDAKVDHKRATANVHVLPWTPLEFADRSNGVHIVGDLGFV